ncbi:MAG TPA: hypothetical protein VIK78_16145 [Ruminiclostridium sp.]
MQSLLEEIEASDFSTISEEYCVFLLVKATVVSLYDKKIITITMPKLLLPRITIELQLKAF